MKRSIGAIGISLIILTSAWSETVTLFATCKTLGRLEQCGCVTDIEGGLEARAGYLEKARQETPNALLIDLGGFMPLKTEKKKPAFVLPNELEINAAVGETNLQAMNQLGYDIILPSPDDFVYGLNAIVKNSTPTGKYLCTQIGTALDWIAPFRVIEQGGIKIGFIGASSLLEKSVKVPEGAELMPASKTIPPAVEELRAKQGVDAVVLLVHEPPPTVKRWLSEYQGQKIDAVVTVDFGISVDKLGETFIANASSKGRAIGKIVLSIEKGQGVTDMKFERVTLYPSHYPHPRMRDFLTQSYSRMIDALKLRPATNQTGVSGSDIHTVSGSENSYLGAEVCMSCHQEEYDQWKTTRHASAFLDLLEQTRQWVPECAQCHVTGFGKPGGFQQFPQTSGFMHVQCESCHGPGQRHVAEYGLGEIQRTPDKSACLQCHTPKFSPKFESMYDLYIKQVKHK